MQPAPELAEQPVVERVVGAAGPGAASPPARPGRFRLGIGTSGPQVMEGFHGVPFDAPLGRTREDQIETLAAMLRSIT